MSIIHRSEQLSKAGGQQDRQASDEEASRMRKTGHLGNCVYQPEEQAWKRETGHQGMLCLSFSRLSYCLRPKASKTERQGEEKTEDP